MKNYILKIMLTLWLLVGLATMPARAYEEEDDWWDNWREVFYGDDGVPAGLTDEQEEQWLESMSVFFDNHEYDVFLGETNVEVEYGWECNGCNGHWNKDVRLDEPGNEDHNHNGIKDNTEDLNHDRILDMYQDFDGNNVSDYLQDGDDDGIPDPDDPDFYTFDDPNGDGAARNVDGDYPQREIPLNLPTEAEKNEYIMKIVDVLTEKLQEKLREDFVPFPEVFYKNMNNSYATTNINGIEIKNPFFNVSDAMQFAIILHEHIHWLNQVNNKYISYNADGKIVKGVITFSDTDNYIYPVREFSDEAKVFIKQFLIKEQVEGTSVSKDFEDILMNMHYSPQRISGFTYVPSNLLRDEIACYEAMLQGYEDGWYQLSELEIAAIKYKLEDNQFSFEIIRDYELKNNIQPNGDGFQKP